MDLIFAIDGFILYHKKLAVLAAVVVLALLVLLATQYYQQYGKGPGHNYTSTLQATTVSNTTTIATIQPTTTVVQTGVIKTLYVNSTIGSSKGDGTQVSPFGEISQAVDAAPQGGAIIQVGPGVYYDNVSIVGKEIRIIGARAGTTVINASGKDNGVYISGQGSAGSAVENLTINNGRWHAILAQDTSNISVLNMVLEGNGGGAPICISPTAQQSSSCLYESSAVELDGVSNSVLGNLSTVQNSGAGIGISDLGNVDPGAPYPVGVSAGSENDLVYKASVSDNSGSGVVITAYSRGVSNVVVRNLSASNNDAGVEIATMGSGAEINNVTVEHSTMTYNKMPGIVAYTAAAGSSIDNTTIYNNSISMNGPSNVQGVGTVNSTGIALAQEAGVFGAVQMEGNIVSNEYYGLWLSGIKSIANTYFGYILSRNSFVEVNSSLHMQ